MILIIYRDIRPSPEGYYDASYSLCRKYENAGMKFSTVPAFALAESRASDACCLFLVQKHTRAKSACFPPQESSDQVLDQTGLIADVATHSLDPRAATRAVPVRNLPAAAHAALL